MVSPGSANSSTEKPNDLWNRLSFLNEDGKRLGGLGEAFCGISFQISDCRAFSPFETVPGILDRNSLSVNYIANLL